MTSLDSTVTSPCSALVIFGITGDLARKKLFSALYELAILGDLNMPVIGVGRSQWSTERLREVAANSIDTRVFDKGTEQTKSAAKDHTLSSLEYISGSYDSTALYEALVSKLDNHEHILCYLAVPPEAFEEIVKGLGNSRIRTKVRLLIEKPFGNDRQSASGRRRACRYAGQSAAAWRSTYCRRSRIVPRTTFRRSVEYTDTSSRP